MIPIQQLHSNIQLQNVIIENDTSILDSFPKDAIINVEIIDGKKEGEATVKSLKGVPLAKLNFKND